jgi:murein DD-endopeptidase MepM/ murein hydrolase activator NlpD
VILAHPAGVFSMYGHLDPAVAVRVGDAVQRGSLLGTVLRRGDAVPDHLHYEVRTFLTTTAVNGDQPRYAARCGPNCPPGPGYWPIAAPDHASDLGWRNPTHVVNGRNAPPIAQTGGTARVVAQPISPTLTLWSAAPGGATPPIARGELSLLPGAALTLHAIDAGAEDTRGTSAAAYRLWYEISTADGRRGWVHAAVASSYETGSDGRAATVRFNLLFDP